MLIVQATAEVLGVTLAVLCTLVPSLDKRLQEAAPGRGRKAAAQQSEGAAEVFCLNNHLTDEQKEVLEWDVHCLLIRISLCFNPKW